MCIIFIEKSFRVQDPFRVSIENVQLKGPGNCLLYFVSQFLLETESYRSEGQCKQSRLSLVLRETR